MTDDQTQFQRTPDGKPDVPRGKWKWQRGTMVVSMACATLYPILLLTDSADKAIDFALYWYAFHGGVVGAWFGGSTFAVMKR